MKRILLLALMTLTFTLVAQGQNVYPVRYGNYCLYPDAVVSASSTHAGFSAASAIDGDRIGQNCNFTAGLAPCWGNDGGWNDNTRDIWPDWLRVDFGRPRAVGRIVFSTFQDNFSTLHIEPYLNLQIGGNYGVEKYTLEVLTPAGTWVQVADVDENYDIIREHKFTPILATAIRITVYNAPLYSRVIEFEAYPV